MRQKVALILLFIISLSLIAKGALAEQVVYQDFELSLNIYHDPTDASASDKYGDVVSVYSFTVSFPNERYLAGITLDMSLSTDPSVTNTVYIYVNGQQVSSKSFTGYTEGKQYFDLASPIHGTTFTVEIKAKLNGYTNSNGDLVPSYFYLYDTWVYSTVEPVKLRSYLEELKYFPPGAEDTPQGFILNQTELLLNQTYTLSAGTISFWLKWDGTKNIKLSDSIGIDDSGYLYIKNDAGTTYTLEGVTLPAGAYVPVYIGWQDGNGYIMVNTTRISLNWEGSLSISKIGGVDTESATIIDEFKLWNTYIPPDQILYESQKEGYTLIWNGHAISITPEGGSSLGNLDVSSLTANFTTLNSTTLSPGQKTTTIPNDTALVVISRNGVSRRYWLGNYTKIAFPAESVQLISSTISIRPTAWQYITLKTPDGRVATRVKLDSTQTASVMAVLGSDYIISLENGNTTKSMLYTITGDISLWVENGTSKYQGKYFTAQLDEQEKRLIITYYDQSASTNRLSLSVEAYGTDNHLKYIIKDLTVKGPVAFYKFALPVNNDTDVMYYRILLNTDGQTYERTVFGTAGAEGVLPSNIIPSGIVIFGAGVVGALMFTAINAYLMPFGALIALGAVKFLGWANVPPSVLGMLGVFSALAMLMYRHDQGVG